MQILEVFPSSQTSGCLFLQCLNWRAEVLHSLISELGLCDGSCVRFVSSQWNLAGVGVQIDFLCGV